MAKKVKEETLNLENILFKCRDILRQAKNSGSFFEKRDMMLTLVFQRFMGEKYEDGVASLRQRLIDEGLDPDDEEIIKAFFDDATFADGTFDLPVEARWSTIINTAAPQLNVALDTALRSIGETNPTLKGCFVEGTFTQRNLGANDMKKIEQNNWTLVPSKYIEFIDHDLEIDYPKEMARIQQEMKELMQREKESQKMLEEAFKGIGYSINKEKV